METTPSPLARCFLLQHGDTTHQAILTTQSLEITQKRRREYFDLSSVKSIELVYRKILFPLVIGGIITPLAGLALFTSYGPIHFIFALFFLGLFLFYYGITGTQSIVVTTSWKVFDFFVRDTSPQLEAFVRYTSNVVAHPLGHCFLLRGQENTAQVSPEAQRLYYLDEKVDAVAPQQTLWLLDPLLAPEHIQLVKNPANGQLVPYTQGILPLQALSRLDSPA
jgi:hypothetical protein